MNDLFYKISLLFFAYSFLAWLAETAVATIKEKDFRNRGFVSGPFCFAYGLTAVVLTVFFREFVCIIRCSGVCWDFWQCGM